MLYIGLFDLHGDIKAQNIILAFNLIAYKPENLTADNLKLRFFIDKIIFESNNNEFMKLNDTIKYLNITESTFIKLKLYHELSDEQQKIISNNNILPTVIHLLNKLKQDKIDDKEFFEVYRFQKVVSLLFNFINILKTDYYFSDSSLNYLNTSSVIEPSNEFLVIFKYYLKEDSSELTTLIDNVISNFKLNKANKHEIIKTVSNVIKSTNLI